jgi:hypothetical protein
MKLLGRDWLLELWNKDNWQLSFQETSGGDWLFFVGPFLLSSSPIISTRENNS